MSNSQPEKNGDDYASENSLKVLADLERYLFIAQLKVKSPGYLRHIIFEGLKGYGQGITAIPADADTLLNNFGTNPKI